MSNAQKAQDFVTSFMNNLAEGVELTQSLQAVFAKILAEQVVVDADTNVVNFKPAFSTLLKVLTFIATPEADRPEAGSSYTQDAIDTAAGIAATETGLTVGEEIPTEAPTEEPVDPELPTDEPTEEPVDPELPTDEPTEEPGVEGNTLELTTGADVIAPLAEGEEAVEGVLNTTENDDTINALTGSYSATTLQKNDQIDGGAGNDTLNVALSSKFGGFTGDGFLKNVETVNLTNDGTSSRTFDAKQVEGVETYNLDGLVDLGSLASADVAVNVANRAEKGTVKIGYATDVTEGTEDVLNLGVTNLGAAATKKGTKDIAEQKVTVEAAGIENLNLTATGANFVTLNTVDVTDITVKGAGSLKLNGLAKEVTDVDASALAGNLNLDLGAVSGANSIKGGAGDDRIIAKAGNLKVNSKIDGGEGKDTLVLNDITSSVDQTLQLDMVGVETIQLNGLTKDLTYSAAKTAALEALEVLGTISGDAVFAGMEGDLEVTLNTATNSGTVSSDHDGVTTLNVNNAAGNKDSIEKSTANVSFSKTDNLNITVAAFNDYSSGSISAAAAENASLTLDGSMGANTAATLKLGAAQSLVINDNNKAEDKLILEAKNLEELTVNVANAIGDDSGDFTIDSGATNLDGLKSLNVNTAGVFKAESALKNIADINLMGTGAVTLGDLGDAKSEDNITLTAAGLAGGLTTGAIETADGYSVDIDVSEVLGAVDFSGGITVANKEAEKTGSISITAEGTASTIALGELNAKTVTVDAGDALGVITADGTDSGDAVKIEADTASFTGSSISTNNVEVTAKEATIVGSLVDDKFTVNAIAGEKTTAELTGGLGADTFTINATATGTAAQQLIVTITDFNAGEDILDSVTSLGSLGTVAANGTVSAGVTGASLISNPDEANDGKFVFASQDAANTFFKAFNAFDSSLNFTVETAQLATVRIDGSDGTDFVAGVLHNNDFYTYTAAQSADASVLVKLVGVDTVETYDFAVAAAGDTVPPVDPVDPVDPTEEPTDEPVDPELPTDEPTEEPAADVDADGLFTGNLAGLQGLSEEDKLLVKSIELSPSDFSIAEAVALQTAITATGFNSEFVAADVKYTLKDSLANLEAAGAGIVAGADSYEISDIADLKAADLVDQKVTELAAAQAAAVTALKSNTIVTGASNNADAVVTNGAYTLADTLAALTDAAPAILSESAGYEITDIDALEINLTEATTVDGLAAAQKAAAELNSIVAGASNKTDVAVTSGTYSLVDTAANLVDSANSAVVTGAATVTADAALDVSEAEALHTVRADSVFEIEDSAANIVAGDAAVVAAAASYALTDAAGAIAVTDVTEAEATITAVTGASNANDYTVTVSSAATAITTEIVDNSLDLSGATSIEHTATEAATTDGATGTDGVADTFVFASGADVTIASFATADGDKINLSDLNITSAVIKTDFSDNTAGTVVVAGTTDATVAFDTSGNGSADFTITLTGVANTDVTDLADFFIFA